MQPKEHVEMAESRRAIYALLTKIFSEPPSKELVEQMTTRFLPIFSQDVKANPSEVAEGLTNSLQRESVEEVLRQDYADLFQVPAGRYLAPYESVYREARMMGKCTTEVKRLYRMEGIDERRGLQEVPDHLGLELDFMRFLCEREAEAWRSGNESLASRYLRVERNFLANHLAKWVPQLCNKLSHAQTAFYREVAHATDKFLMLDLEEVETTLENVSNRSSPQA